MQRLPLALVSCPPQNQDQHPLGRSVKSLTLKWKVLSSSKSLCSDWEHPGGKNPACLALAFLISHVLTHVQG